MEKVRHLILNTQLLAAEVIRMKDQGSGGVSRSSLKTLVSFQIIMEVCWCALLWFCPPSQSQSGVLIQIGFCGSTVCPIVGRALGHIMLP